MQRTFLYKLLQNDPSECSDLYYYISTVTYILNTLVAHGSVVCNCMSRAKLFMNPLIEGPGTIFGW